MVGDGGRHVTGSGARSVGRWERFSLGIARRLGRRSRAELDPGDLGLPAIDLSVLWSGPFAPRGWLDVLERSAAPDHAAARLWWLRSEVLPGIARAADAAGMGVAAPWSAPALEDLCARIPEAARAEGPGALVARAFGDPGSTSRPAPPPWDVSAREVAQTLEGWLDAGAVRAIWEHPAAPAAARWRLQTLAGWRASGTVG
jgi:hypothetical protein